MYKTTEERHHLKNLTEHLPQGLAAMVREIFVIGAESESVMLRWAVRILSCNPTVQVFSSYSASYYCCCYSPARGTEGD